MDKTRRLVTLIFRVRSSLGQVWHWPLVLRDGGDWSDWRVTWVPTAGLRTQGPGPRTQCQGSQERDRDRDLAYSTRYSMGPCTVFFLLPGPWRPGWASASRSLALASWHWLATSTDTGTGTAAAAPALTAPHCTALHVLLHRPGVEAVPGQRLVSPP